MPAIQHGPPTAGTYRFVAMRTDIHARGLEVQPITFYGYAETQVSRSVEFDGSYVQALFFRTPEAHNRACCMGWKDITEPFLQAISEEKKAQPQASTEAQRKILSTLCDKWMSKREIISMSDIKDSEWRTSVKTLMDRGLVECNYGPRQRKAASNRRYLYRLTKG